MALPEACTQPNLEHQFIPSLSHIDPPSESVVVASKRNTELLRYHSPIPLQNDNNMPRAGYDFPRPIGPERPPKPKVTAAPSASSAETSGKTSGNATTLPVQPPGNGKSFSTNRNSEGDVLSDLLSRADCLASESSHNSNSVLEERKKRLYIDIFNIIRSTRLSRLQGHQPVSDRAQEHQPDDVHEDGLDDDDDDEDRWIQPEDGSECCLTRQYENVINPQVLYQELLFEKLVFDMASKGNVKVTSDENEENSKLSSKQLLDQCDNGKIITHFREYQTELFERAKLRNSIVVLDTGAGKTMIAMLLLRYMIQQNMEDRLSGKPRKISFFLVPSTPLVFQQAKTIQSNLPYPVESLCGALNTDAWDVKKWTETFSKYEIIVCTGEILNHCLHHAFIQMKNICLIIFDEAHHAKLNHVYAKIARNHYYDTPVDERPRLFGMTASPINSSSYDVENQIAELEYLMDSRIITTSDPALIKHALARPKEIDRFYETLSDNELLELSPLRKNLDSILKTVPEYTKLLSQAEAVTKELGLWAGDYIWKFVLDDDFRYRVERRLNRDHPGDIAMLDDVRRRLDEAQEVIKKYVFEEPKSTTPSISPKVQALIQALRPFDYNSQDKCLVFVEKRVTAKILCAMFSRPEFGPLWLKPGMIIGGGSSTATLGEIKQSVNKQFTSILGFRKGTLNCLFATSVAEEGLDIPDCNIVIRFDLYRTMIQYIQSRGRARHAHSRYYHFLEKGNFRQAELRERVKAQEAVMRDYCKALPEDRKVESKVEETARDNQVVWRHPKSGAKITFQSAVQLVYQIATQFPTTDPDGARAIFVMHKEAGEYQCKVILPDGMVIVGHPSPQKLGAKQNAACRTCRYLYTFGYFDEYLVPRVSPTLHLQTSDRLALDVHKKKSYIRRSKPLQWRWDDNGTLPQEVYICVLDIKGDLTRPHLPLCLLSRTAVPSLANFPIFTDDGGVRDTNILPYGTPIRVTREELEMYTSYTLRIFQDVFAKTYEPDVEKMSYWLAPLRELPSPAGANPFPFIDLENVKKVHYADPERYWVSGMNQDQFMDKYLIDRWNKRRRGFSRRIHPTLRPNDPHPTVSTKDKKAPPTILDYSISLWKASRENYQDRWDHDQPVVELEFLHHRIHYFTPPKKKELQAPRTGVICPQTFRISLLKPAHVSMAMVFPALIHRIEDTIVSLEGIQALGLDVTDPKLALETFTADLTNHEDDSLSPEDDIQRLNVVRTMGPSYERLEFLGDTFLKMAVSIELFCAVYAGKGRDGYVREFQLHENRKLLVCNSNMFKTAMEKELVQFARCFMFTRRTWYPHGLKLLEGKKTEAVDVQLHLADKSVADFCEAAIGACFVQHFDANSWKREDWDAAIHAVHVVTTNSISLDLNCVPGLRSHLSQRFDDYLDMYKAPHWTTKPPTEYMRLLGEKVYQADGYRFNNLRMLQSAFTHQTSVLTGLDSVPSYQLLEFLGDSLLDLACVEYLYFEFPTRGPEWMTKHKMAMVSNQFFSVLSINLGFSKLLTHCSTAISYAIEIFADQVATASADPDAPVDFWTRLPEAPKFLSDVVEAYVGALFIDSDFDFNQVRRFFRQHVLPHFRSISMYDTFASKHPVNGLQRILDHGVHCQSAILRSAPVFGPPIPNTVDPDTGEPKRKQFFVGAVVVHNQILSHHVSTSARMARTGAAKQGLAILEEMSREDYQKAYECDCKAVGRRDIFT